MGIFIYTNVLNMISFQEEKKKKQTHQIAGLPAVLNVVGICASSACADVTVRQQENGGERENRPKKGSSTAGLEGVKTWFSQ